MNQRFHLLTLLSLLAALPVVALAEARGENWPSFRGPQASGVAEGQKTPTTWNTKTGENVLWKTSIPGLGHSSPVIWDQRLFVTTAIAEAGDVELKVGLYGDGNPADDNGKQTWRLYCLDKESGKILWRRDVHQGSPKIKRHAKSSHANSTPATDGERVVAFFGSEGLHAYDLDGKPLWKKDFGVLHSGSFRNPNAQWGFGSSPVLHEGKVVIQADVFKGSFLTVLDAKTGDEVWRVARAEHPTWSTPTILKHGKRTLILVNGYWHMGAYDFETGAEIWRLAGGGDLAVPTPIVGHGLVYLSSAHGAKRPVYAIRPDAQGDISLKGDATTNAGIVWSVPRGGTYIPTPLLYGDQLYVHRTNGVLYSYNAKTGDLIYEVRVAGGQGFTASAVAADGKIYITSENGKTHVIEPGSEYKEIAVNALDEIVMASPAISANTLYFRTQDHIFALRERQPVNSPDNLPDKE